MKPFPSWYCIPPSTGCFPEYVSPSKGTPVAVCQSTLLHHCDWTQLLVNIFHFNLSHCRQLLRNSERLAVSLSHIRQREKCGPHFCRIKEAVYHSSVRLHPKNTLILAKLIIQPSFPPQYFVLMDTWFSEISIRWTTKTRWKKKLKI